MGRALRINKTLGRVFTYCPSFFFISGIAYLAIMTYYRERVRTSELLRLNAHHAANIDLHALCEFDHVYLYCSSCRASNAYHVDKNVEAPKLFNSSTYDALAFSFFCNIGCNSNSLTEAILLNHFHCSLSKLMFDVDADHAAAGFGQ